MSLTAMTLFSEDLRFERSGTDMLIGILPDHLEIPAPFPIAIGKLAIYTRIRLSYDDPIEPITLTLAVNSDENQLTLMDEAFVRAAVNGAKEAGSPFAGLTSRSIFSGIPIEVPTRFLVVVSTPTVRFESGFLNVVSNPTSDPTASQQPS